MLPELQEVRAWIEKADHDRQTAEAVMDLDPPITDTAVFHAQQAVEKYLKAFLVWRRYDFEKIHDLEKLVGDCAKFEAEFEAIKPIVDPLTAYAVRFRYPVAKDPTEEEVRDALAAWTRCGGLLPDDCRLRSSHDACGHPWSYLSMRWRSLSKWTVDKPNASRIDE